MTYEPTKDAILVVPTEVICAINAKLDAAILNHPGAAADRAYLYNCLLGFFDVYGYLPDFDLHRVDTTGVAK